MTLLTSDSFSQNENFKTIVKNPATGVKFQMESGQGCWSYATCSFLESELIRTGKGTFDLSEDFFIYHTYIKKGLNYVLRHGNTSFKNGGLAHDVLKIIKEIGIVPSPYFKIDHIAYTRGPTVVLKSYLNTILEENYLEEDWMRHYLALLNSYFSERSEQFLYKNNTYTPKSFADYLEINVDDYISVTSFTHHQFNEEFILEIPDNYSNGYYFNLPLNDLIQIVDTCLEKGYTLVWDGCIDGNGYANEKGLIMEPKDRYNKNIDLKSNTPEDEINQQKRQIAFERLQVTDDHLMHIIGMAENDKGKKFYIVKDSGGEYGPYNGYLYMSESFFKMKTIAITLNKNALPESIKLMMSKK
jgi:bleomycin hydrolase